MASQFNTIGIMGRVNNPAVMETLKALIHYLKSLNQALCIEAETAAAIQDHSLVSVTKEQLGEKCDLLIVVGGDGSLLHAARTVVDKNIPILGVNRGRLGFLTDIHPTKLEKIKAILEGDYLLEKRFLITATVEHHGKVLGKSDALNEVALIPDSVPHMNEFEIYIDDQFV
ncbi:MAG: NAD kinase, partial [Gammaproteobacteria bacterium]